MTLEEIRCFREAKGAVVRIESLVGTIAYSWKGTEIEPTVFPWQGDPPLALAPQVLDKADKFIRRLLTFA